MASSPSSSVWPSMLSADTSCHDMPPLTYEQEIGAVILSAMSGIGLVARDNAGGHWVWSHTMPTGARIELFAYEGQLFAETDEPVWSVAWYDGDDFEPVRTTDGLTMAAAMQAARPER